MESIEVRSELPTPPARVWSVLGDFAGVASWNPFVDRAEVAGEGIGMTRTIVAKGGARIVETLEAVDQVDHRIRYAVHLESGARSVADVRLEAAADGGTVVVWQSIRDTMPDPGQRDVIEAALRSRIDALARAVEVD
jgi:mxaD protein